MEQHQRRKRYKGTHPRHFSEKYKEHNPEKYKDTIEKVISKGNTPAGMHLSIMVDEILNVLSIKPGDIGIDCTLGYGGHTRKMLEQLNGIGHMYALDIDPIEIVNTTNRLHSEGFNEDILTIKHINFKDIDIALDGKKVDFLLADLGVSSMQIDNPSRGFSYKTEGPLDLRLNPLEGVPASVRLMELSKEEIEGMLIENSDEPYAKEIAQAISKRKYLGEISTTKELYHIIEDALSFLPNKDKKEIIKKTCQRVFQAIRIDVNSEFEVLYEFLEKLPFVLAPGARVAILTFHSGEDRLVKKAFKEYYNSGIFKEISKDVIRPTQEECFRNPRAKSTKLRYAVMNDEIN